MRRVRRHIPAIAGFALLVTLTGCVERRLKVPDPAGEVVIRIEWADDAPVKPAGAMDYRFYHEDGTAYETFEGVTGAFRHEFPVGTYRVLVSNSDAERVVHRGTEKYETARIFAEERETHDDPVHWNILAQPYRVFGTGDLEGLRVIEVRNRESAEYTARLNDLVKRVHVRIGFSGHSATVTAVTGKLKGVSRAVTIESREYLHEGSDLVEFTTVKADGEELFKRTVCAFDLHTTTMTGKVTVELEVTSSRYGTMEQTADLNALIETLRAGNGGELPADIYVDLTVTYTPLGVGEIEVGTWEPGEDEDIEIE